MTYADRYAARATYEDARKAVAGLMNMIRGTKGEARKQIKAELNEYIRIRDLAYADSLMPGRKVKQGTLGWVTGSQITAHIEDGSTTHDWQFNGGNCRDRNGLEIFRQRCAVCGATRTMAHSKTTGRPYVVQR